MTDISAKMNILAQLGTVAISVSGSTTKIAVQDCQVFNPALEALYDAAWKVRENWIPDPKQPRQRIFAPGVRERLEEAFKGRRTPLAAAGDNFETTLDAVFNMATQSPAGTVIRKITVGTPDYSWGSSGYGDQYIEHYTFDKTAGGWDVSAPSLKAA